MQSYLKKGKVRHEFVAFCLIIFQTQMTLITQIKKIKIRVICVKAIAKLSFRTSWGCELRNDPVSLLRRLPADAIEVPPFAG